jgi:hypothetical protein
MKIPARMMAAGEPRPVIKEVPADLAAYIVMGVDEYRNLTRRYLETFRKSSLSRKISEADRTAGDTRHTPPAPGPLSG